MKRIDLWEQRGRRLVGWGAASALLFGLLTIGWTWLLQYGQEDFPGGLLSMVFVGATLLAVFVTLVGVFVLSSIPTRRPTGEA